MASGRAMEASSFLEATRPLFLCCRLAACSCNRLHCALASTSSSWLGLGIGLGSGFGHPRGKAIYLYAASLSCSLCTCLDSWAGRAGRTALACVWHASRHRHVEPPGATVQAGGWRCD